MFLLLPNLYLKIYLIIHWDSEVIQMAHTSIFAYFMNNEVRVSDGEKKHIKIVIKRRNPTSQSAFLRRCLSVEVIQGRAKETSALI